MLNTRSGQNWIYAKRKPHLWSLNNPFNIHNCPIAFEALLIPPMLRFLRSGTDHLFHWAGIVQRTKVKTLSPASPLPESDLRSLIQFCFPTPEPMSGPLFFVFRSKFSNRKFYNVFCLLDQTSYQLRDLDSKEQCCLCVVSPFYHFAVFGEILKAVRSLLLTGPANAQRFLDVLRRSPRQITTVPELSELYSPASSYDCELAKVSADSPAQLRPCQLGRLVIGLLTDSPMIVVSSNLSVMSTFCYSLVSLIAPLEWHHMFAPVLPASCLESVQCPTPYIVGIHRLLLPQISGCETEGHIFIDLDARAVSYSGIAPLPAWAEQLADSLKTGANTEFQQLIVAVICQALGVQPASNYQTTGKRIRMALAANPPDPASFAGMLFGSRTIQAFVDALRQPVLPPSFARFLASGSPGGITSPAIQQLDEFPPRTTRRKTRSDGRVVHGSPGTAKSVLPGTTSDEHELSIGSSSPVEGPSEGTGE
jgi:hypothetical protein